MDCQTAFDDHVRVKLESSFGKAVAMLILASASNSTGIMTGKLDYPAYMRLCEAITSDQRVVDMWGASGASETFVQWRGLAG